MSWVDLVIAIVVVLAAVRGFAEGAIRQVAGLAGLGAGFLLGTSVAPTLSGDITKTAWRPAVAIFIVLIIMILGGIVGGVIGGIIKHLVSAVMLGMVDRIIGVALGAAGALVLCWLSAGLLASATWGTFASGIQRSAILAALDHVMPPVPSIEARVQSLFRNAGVPNIFATVVTPTLPQSVNPKRLGPLVTSLGQPSEVVKVLASGSCGTISEGTAFYVSSNEVVTNAHVVAGQPRVTVNGSRAVVALYDPTRDLAILRVSQRQTPLTFTGHEPKSGTAISVVGFPLDSSRTSAPGYFEGLLTGSGRDIYNQVLTTKTVLALEVNVNPGNSGSPVLVNGRVAGVLESKSLSQSSTAYAIPDAAVEYDVAKAPATGRASTRSCLP